MEYLTIGQLAERWHVCIMTIRRMVYLGKVPYSRIGRKLLFKVSEIEQLENEKSKSVLR